jgi:hypothetical protein
MMAIISSVGAVVWSICRLLDMSRGDIVVDLPRTDFALTPVAAHSSNGVRHYESQTHSSADTLPSLLYRRPFVFQRPGNPEGGTVDSGTGTEKNEI